MVMLSELLHFRVSDAQGENTKLADLAIRQLDTDYPFVTHLIYRHNHEGERALPWSTVKAIDQRNRQIKVQGYEQTQDVEALDKAVRLRRDVLDALVLDLQNRRATRANDLWLEEEAGQLCLAAADTSARAILRRIAPGR